jgi:hypothetical protein
MGGSIEIRTVEASEGHGTVAKVRVPRARGDGSLA